jgi:hypothetical protein
MTAKRRPRSYAPLDVDYLGRRRVQELADEHGQGGPLVWVALILEAKKQAFIEKNPDRQGELKMTYSTLAEMTFCSSAEQAQAIVRSCIHLGLVEAVKLDPKRFLVRLTAWSKWEPDDVNAADRQQRSREQKRQQNTREREHEPDDPDVDPVPF